MCMCGAQEHAPPPVRGSSHDAGRTLLPMAGIHASCWHAHPDARRTRWTVYHMLRRSCIPARLNRVAR